MITVWRLRVTGYGPSACMLPALAALLTSSPWWSYADRGVADARVSGADDRVAGAGARRGPGTCGRGHRVSARRRQHPRVHRGRHRAGHVCRRAAGRIGRRSGRRARCRGCRRRALAAMGGRDGGLCHRPSGLLQRRARPPLPRRRRAGRHLRPAAADARIAAGGGSVGQPWPGGAASGTARRDRAAWRRYGTIDPVWPGRRLPRLCSCGAALPARAAAVVADARRRAELDLLTCHRVQRAFRRDHACHGASADRTHAERDGGHDGGQSGATSPLPGNCW